MKKTSSAQTTKEFIKSALGSTKRDPEWEYGEILPVRAKRNEQGEMEREWGLGYSNTAKSMYEALTAPRRAMQGEEFTPEQAMEMAMNITAPGVATARYAPGVLNMPLVYHGTPHRFDPTPDNPLGEFDASKIGTGEGAQAYGHGVYLAESPNVAKEYAINLANRDLANQGRLNAHANAKRLATLAGDPKYAADDIRSVLELNPEHEQAGLLKATLEMLESGDYAKPLKTQGSLYTADLPDEMIDRMLDWDKPLSEQPTEIREAVKKLPVLEGTQKFLDSGQAKGKAVHSYLEDGLKYTPQQIVQLMREAGILGIKYLDQNSRDKGKGTRNFVVFPGEEKKAKIIKRD